MQSNAKIATGTVVALTMTAIVGVIWLNTGGEAILSRYLQASLNNTARTAKIDLAKSTVRLQLIDRNAIFDATAMNDEATVVCGIARASFDPTKRLYFAYSTPDETLVIGDNPRNLARVSGMCESIRRDR
jgi:hypothetical protein